MKTFIADIIPRIQRYSQKLDNHTLLINQHWIVFDEYNSSKKVYIFRPNNQLLISNNGIVEKGKWENIGNNSILIDINEESYLFKHGFFDQNILALKLDGKNEYAFLINENRYAGELNSIDKIIEFLSENYLEKSSPNKMENKRNKSTSKQKIQIIELPMNKIETSNGIIFIEGPVSLMDGRKVYKDLQKEPANDGKYKIGFMWHIHVRNGVVVNTTLT